MNKTWMATATLLALLAGVSFYAAAPATRPTPTTPAPSTRPTRPASEAEVPRIEQQAFRQAFDAHKVTVVDTRSASAYAQGHVPGALLWDSEPAQLEAQLARLRATNKAIVTYCT